MLIVSASIATLAAANPHRRATPSTVQELPADVQGPNTGALRHIPSNLPADELSFLNKYQPHSNVASAQIGSKDQDPFTSSGYCFAEYPCFSVQKGGVATIGTGGEITKEQVSKILDDLLSNPQATFDQSNKDTVFSGLKTTVDGAVLEVIASPGTIDSNFLAGMVFDMYKMQSDNPSTNSIRAVQAKTDGKDQPFVGLCLYPQSADPTKAYNFCLGKELDGTPMPAKSLKVKRFSIQGGLSFICGLIEVPLLCHHDDSTAEAA
jgi:hypothetical protein